MKKLLLFACLLAVLTGCEKKDVKNIETLPKEINAPSDGGKYDVAVTSTLSWVVESDKEWAVPSPTAGANNGTFSLAVSHSKSFNEEVANIKVIATNGETATVVVKLQPMKGEVTDVCNNKYSVVLIGSQVWMKGNLKCAKYDTESEAYKEKRYSIPMSSTGIYTPYYNDATNRDGWDYDSRTKYGKSLSTEQVDNLGYLYNWAAAVGVEDGETHTVAFTGNRQGICPNGWHVPSKAEWDALVTYSGGKTITGNKLKTTTGWYENKNATDVFGFSALPAGETKGSVISNVGVYGMFSCSSLVVNEDKRVYYIYMDYWEDFIYVSGSGYKNEGFALRCVMN